MVSRRVQTSRTGFTLFEIEKIFSEYFQPHKDKHHAHFLFNNMRVVACEVIIRYVARLSDQARDCEFRDLQETAEMILEHIFQTVSRCSEVGNSETSNSSRICKRQVKRKVSIERGHAEKFEVQP